MRSNVPHQNWQTEKDIETEVNNRLKPVSPWETFNTCLIVLIIVAVVALVLVSIKQQPKQMTKLDNTKFGAWLERTVSL